MKLFPHTVVLKHLQDVHEGQMLSLLLSTYCVICVTNLKLYIKNPFTNLPKKFTKTRLFLKWMRMQLFNEEKITLMILVLLMLMGRVLMLLMLRKFFCRCWWRWFRASSSNWTLWQLCVCHSHPPVQFWWGLQWEGAWDCCKSKSASIKAFGKWKMNEACDAPMEVTWWSKSSWFSSSSAIISSRRCQRH